MRTHLYSCQFQYKIISVHFAKTSPNLKFCYIRIAHRATLINGTLNLLATAHSFFLTSFFFADETCLKTIVLCFILTVVVSKQFWLHRYVLHTKNSYITPWSLKSRLEDFLISSRWPRNSQKSTFSSIFFKGGLNSEGIFTF